MCIETESSKRFDNRQQMACFYDIEPGKMEEKA